MIDRVSLSMEEVKTFFLYLNNLKPPPRHNPKPRWINAPLTTPTILENQNRRLGIQRQPNHPTAWQRLPNR